jgi:hypothetical protein
MKEISPNALSLDHGNGDAHGDEEKNLSKWMFGLIVKSLNR